MVWYTLWNHFRIFPNLKSLSLFYQMNLLMILQLPAGTTSRLQLKMPIIRNFGDIQHGTRHDFMPYENYHLTIPNNREYSVSQLRLLL